MLVMCSKGFRGSPKIGFEDYWKQPVGFQISFFATDFFFWLHLWCGIGSVGWIVVAVGLPAHAAPCVPEGRVLNVYVFTPECMRNPTSVPQSSSPIVNLYFCHLGTGAFTAELI